MFKLNIKLLRQNQQLNVIGAHERVFDQPFMYYIKLHHQRLFNVCLRLYACVCIYFLLVSDLKFSSLLIFFFIGNAVGS